MSIKTYKLKPIQFIPYFRSTRYVSSILFAIRCVLSQGIYEVITDGLLLAHKRATVISVASSVEAPQLAELRVSHLCGYYD